MREFDRAHFQFYRLDSADFVKVFDLSTELYLSILSIRFLRVGRAGDGQGGLQAFNSID